MRSIFVTVAACALFAAGSAYAGDASPKPADKDPVICKTTPPPVGTRLGGRHICMKASQWEQRRQQSQDALTNSQNRGQINGVKGGG
jgi:hypothetical protein